MNSIASLFAAAPSSALDFPTQTVKAASTPFQMLLQAAQGADAAAGSTGDQQHADEAETLQQRLARQLQELLESLGVQPGEEVTLSVSESGDIIADGHALANDIESAINDDARLKADLKQLTENEGLFDPSPFFNDARLEVEVADDAGSAILSWR
jgi:hypothetical protein